MRVNVITASDESVIARTTAAWCSCCSQAMSQTQRAKACGDVLDTGQSAQSCSLIFGMPLKFRSALRDQI